MNIAIFGAGNMADGIATRALAGGHTVRLIDRDDVKGQTLATDLAGRIPGSDIAAGEQADVAAADVVVLAVPYTAALAIAAEQGNALAGKTVVDISNPVDFTTYDSLVTAPGTSAAEQVAATAHPQARIVKAFNTTFAGTLVAGNVGGTVLDVLVAADDPDAKAQVIELVTSGGLNAVDVGALKRSRELEAMQFLHLTLQNTLGSGWGSTIKILMPQP